MSTGMGGRDLYRLWASLEYLDINVGCDLTYVGMWRSVTCFWLLNKRLLRKDVPRKERVMFVEIGKIIVCLVPLEVTLICIVLKLHYLQLDLFHLSSSMSGTSVANEYKFS